MQNLLNNNALVLIIYKSTNQAKVSTNETTNQSFDQSINQLMNHFIHLENKYIQLLIIKVQ